MERFVDRHKNRIAGSISGFDRMRFTGTLRWMAHVDGMEKFLNSQGVLLKNFGTYVEKISEQIKQYASGVAEAKGRPVEYDASSSDSQGGHRVEDCPTRRDQRRTDLHLDLCRAMPSRSTSKRTKSRSS